MQDHDLVTKEEVLLEKNHNYSEAKAKIPQGDYELILGTGKKIQLWSEIFSEEGSIF